ncbi:MAG: FtsX-like permease family protein [Candidatus Aminicenantes bacterium]|nr:FtsX-like permease family protein [Candidatus Aminicenantes bacterium]
MYKNFLIVALRNLRRNKLNTLINIFGLGTGVACSILSFLFIRNELSFDRFHKNLDDIFEVKIVLVLPVGRAVSVPKAHTALELVHQFPEVIRAVRIERQNSVVRFKNKIFEEKTLATDPSFLDMFTFPLKYAETTDILGRPDSVVLTETMAQKYFGTENPLGKILSIRLSNEFSDFVITGILKDIPDSSSLNFDFLINLEKLYGNSLHESQTERSVTCFIQLENYTQAKALQEKFTTTIDLPVQKRFSKDSGHVLQAFADFHLRGQYDSYVLSQKSTINYSLILAAISLLVMMIACFNFMNLSIGKASTRIKEIGVRKVLGAHRKQLIVQFWFESLMCSFLSLMIGLVMAELFMPAFNRLSQKNLRLDVFSNEWNIIFYTGLVFLVGIAAGSYPALFLSKFSSIDLFRGKMKLSRKSIFSRTLIVFQFGISIFLIISTIFMYKQKTYMLNRYLGYDADQVIVLPLKNLTADFKRSTAFISNLKNNLLLYDRIQGVSGSASSLSEGWMGTYFERMSGEPSLVVYNYVDQDFFPTLGMKLVAGRNFSDEYPSDLEGSIVINESFAKMLSVKAPVGRRLSEFFKSDFDREIIGVVEDFHSQSMHGPIYPAFIGMVGMDYNFVFIKVKGNRLRETITDIKKEFATLAPQVPFEYSFLDEDVARLYEREEQWIRMVEYASLFAILIACSGLFGLTLQIIFLRTKEIGIRRVLGASARHILLLINREFIWLVLAANIIAWPAAYLAISVVLRNYAFRVTLTPWVFLISGLLALLLATITVSIHTLHAARANPSTTLKYE